MLAPTRLPATATEWRTHATCRATQVMAGRVVDAMDIVAEEAPVALVYNGVSHVVMLATPAELEDFALGFSLSEGILEAPRELYGIDIVHSAAGIEVQLEIAAERFLRLKERRRNLAGRTGCGLCGIDSLEAALRPPARVASAPGIAPEAIARALDRLPDHQRLHGLTGGVHAAAWADVDGSIVLAREDVGRHNALDKLIGGLARAGIPPASGFVVVTSRASYEMVHKTAAFGAALLVAVSAPTVHAIRVAGAAGITLAGFARAGRLSFYTPAHYG